MYVVFLSFRGHWLARFKCGYLAIYGRRSLPETRLSDGTTGRSGREHHINVNQPNFLGNAAGEFGWIIYGYANNTGETLQTTISS